MNPVQSPHMQRQKLRKSELPKVIVGHDPLLSLTDSLIFFKVHIYFKRRRSNLSDLDFDTIFVSDLAIKSMTTHVFSFISPWPFKQ